MEMTCNCHHHSKGIAKHLIYPSYCEVVLAVRKAKKTPLNSISSIDDLNKLIEKTDPDYVRFMNSTWKAQEADISIAAMERAVIAGNIDEVQIAVWREMYADTINTKMAPLWEKAAEGGYLTVAEGLSNIGAAVEWEPIAKIMNKWSKRHAAKLVTQLSNQQRLAVNHLITHYTSVNPINPRAAAKLIRPLVGLTDRDAQTVAKSRDKIYSDLIKDGATNSRASAVADKRAARYTSVMQNRRALNIAHTEQAKVWNRGANESINTMIKEERIVGKINKEWYTAVDERVCDICGPLHGTVVAFDEIFETETGKETITTHTSDIPPIHNRCRCVLIYIHVQ